MPYELNINAGVSGAPQVEALGRSYDNLADRTKRVDEAIRAYVGSNDKLLAKYIDLQRVESQLETVRERHRMQQEQLATATTRGTAAQEQFNSTLTRGTTNVRDMTAALRVMEGGMPIRSAAALLSSFQGMAAISSAIFPIAGGIALFGVVEKVADKLGIQLNIWKQITDAQKTSNDLLTTSTRQYDENLRKLRQIADEEYRRKNGAEAGARREAGESNVDAASAARQAARLQREIQAIQRVITFTHDAQGFVHYPIPTREEAETLRGVVSGITPGRALGDIQMEAARALIPGLNRERLAFTSQERVYQGESGEKLAQAAEEAQRKLEEAVRKREAQENRIAEIQKRAADAYEKSLGTGQGPLGKLISEFGVIRTDTNDLIRQNPGYGGQLRDSALIRAAAASNTFQHENAAETAKVDEEGDRISEKLLEAISKGIEKHQDFMLEGLLGAPAAPSPPAGYVSPSERLRLDRNSSSAQLRRMRGSSPGSIESTQKSAADQEYQDQLRINELKYSGAQREAADLDALAVKKQKYFESEMQREDALQQIIDNQAEQARQLAGSFFDALHSHTTNQWGRNFVVGQARTLFSNATGPVVGQIQNMLGSAIPNVGPLGSLLHGTVFDNSNASPATATAENTKGTWLEVRNLRGDLKGIFTGNSNPEGMVGSGTASAASSIFSLPMSSNPSAMINAAILGTAGTASFASSSTGFLGQLVKGLSGGPSAALASLMGTPAGTVGYGSDGTPHDQYGNPITTSTTQQIGQVASIAAGVATGTMAAIHSFEQGGAGGALGGVSALAGMASLIPGAGIVAAPIAAVTGLLGSLLSTGPAQRAKNIFNELGTNQYLAPTALNVTQSTGGNYLGFDARGNLQTSNFSAVPMVSEPYVTSRVVNGQRTYYNAPGYQVAPYTNGPTGSGQTPVSNAGTTIIVNGGVNAIDPKSFRDVVTQTAHAAAIGDAATIALQDGHGRLGAQIRYHANG